MLQIPLCFGVGDVIAFFEHTWRTIDVKVSIHHLQKANMHFLDGDVFRALIITLTLTRA
jgi:hypothetical protein